VPEETAAAREYEDGIRDRCARGPELRGNFQLRCRTGGAEKSPLGGCPQPSAVLQRAQVDRSSRSRQFDAKASAPSAFDGRSGGEPALDAARLAERQFFDFVSEAICNDEPNGAHTQAPGRGERIGWCKLRSVLALALLRDRGGLRDRKTRVVAGNSTLSGSTNSPLHDPVRMCEARIAGYPIRLLWNRRGSLLASRLYQPPV
jgi:hypothetical protein